MEKVQAESTSHLSLAPMAAMVAALAYGVAPEEASAEAKIEPVRIPMVTPGEKGSFWVTNDVERVPMPSGTDRGFLVEGGQALEVRLTGGTKGAVLVYPFYSNATRNLRVRIQVGTKVYEHDITIPASLKSNIKDARKEPSKKDPTKFVTRPRSYSKQAIAFEIPLVSSGVHVVRISASLGSDGKSPVIILFEGFKEAAEAPLDFEPGEIPDRPPAFNVVVRADSVQAAEGSGSALYGVAWLSDLSPDVPDLDFEKAIVKPVKGQRDMVDVEVQSLRKEGDPPITYRARVKLGTDMPARFEMVQPLARSEVGARLPGEETTLALAWGLEDAGEVTIGGVKTDVRKLIVAVLPDGDEFGAALRCHAYNAADFLPQGEGARVSPSGIYSCATQASPRGILRAVLPEDEQYLTNPFCVRALQALDVEGRKKFRREKQDTWPSSCRDQLRSWLVKMRARR